MHIDGHMFPLRPLWRRPGFSEKVRHAGTASSKGDLAAFPCSSLPQSISIHEAPIKGLSGDLKGWQEVPGELSLPLS